MTDEERRKLEKERMKEEFKQDLKLRQEFLNKAKQSRTTNMLNQAVGNIMSGLGGDDSDEWIAKLNQDTALTEAKIDMALENEASVTKQLEQAANQAELEKLSAQQLVDKMKREMGLLPPEEPAVTPLPEEKTAEEEQPKSPPEKRLGDF
ncbi:MAG: hypothetical protein EAZ89_03415 [Bacteroidetes bacterium]|jgi:hypothetical protein|nr:MAG: hypothetical protein EAZ89_03415 [Bacteroidota bacterium]